MCIIGNWNKKSGSEKMDMYQKRKNRQEMKSNENKDEMQNKMNINWYIPTLINFPRKPYFTRVYI